MTLDEAIKHCEEVIKGNENLMAIHMMNACYDSVDMCNKCNEEHRQLAEWLKELKQLREQTRWIPVSEKLPKAGEYIGDVPKYYLVQNEYGDMLVARYTHSEYWEQIYQLKPIGDKIVAWMPLPEPYKAESEETEAWNGIHAQITAPNGTFERIFNDADDDNDI